MEKTIAAISTAMSASGIGIVRISGDEAMDVISRIYRSKNGKKNIREVQSHTIHYGFIYDGEDVVDEVLVMIMRGPHTYTGEDTVEIDCHGGVYAMKKVLETVLKNGAVIAEPGEFTKRAFLNGRLDLSQAEAVMDVIQANSRLGKRELAHIAHVEPHALVHLARDASRLAELPEPREELCTNRLDALEERRPVDAETRERVRPRLPSDESQLIQRHVAVGMS